jgi:uncharacterized protein (TIGR03437 family)
VVCCAAAQTSPVYTAESIVNASNYTAGPFAPHSILTVFGSGLCFSNPRGVTADDVVDRRLPTELSNCRVYIENSPVPLFYVSPTQINFSVPGSLVPGDVKVRVVRQGITGPEMTLTLVDAAPALFETEAGFVVAAHADYSLVTTDSPAIPDEIIIVYATGLGKTVPNPEDGEIPTTAALLKFADRVKVYLGGSEIDPVRIKYAGVSPYSAGLYQLNIEMPQSLPENPEIRVAMGEQITRAGAKLAYR